MQKHWAGASGREAATGGHPKNTVRTRRWSGRVDPSEAGQRKGQRKAAEAATRERKGGTRPHSQNTTRVRRTPRSPP
eukprot:7415030-Pyramimonas_sp.AAC.1